MVMVLDVLWGSGFGRRPEGRGGVFLVGNWLAGTSKMTSLALNSYCNQCAFTVRAILLYLVELLFILSEHVNHKQQQVVVVHPEI